MYAARTSWSMDLKTSSTLTLKHDGTTNIANYNHPLVQLADLMRPCSRITAPRVIDPKYFLPIFQVQLLYIVHFIRGACNKNP